MASFLSSNYVGARSQDTRAPACLRCSKLSPEPGLVTGAARPPSPAHLDTSVFTYFCRSCCKIVANWVGYCAEIICSWAGAGPGEPYTNSNNPYSWYIFTEMRPNNLIISSAHNGFWAEERRRSEEGQAQFGPIFHPSHENANTAWCWLADQAADNTGPSRRLELDHYKAASTTTTDIFSERNKYFWAPD